MNRTRTQTHAAASPRLDTSELGGVRRARRCGRLDAQRHSRRFVGGDGRGNRVAAFASGALAQRFDYGALGDATAFDAEGAAEPVDATSTGLGPVFGGLDWSGPSACYTAAARVYEPDVGLWTQPDPAGPVDSWYPYVHSGHAWPNYVDPSGLAAQVLAKAEPGNWAPEPHCSVLAGNCAVSSFEQRRIDAWNQEQRQADAALREPLNDDALDSLARDWNVLRLAAGIYGDPQVAGWSLLERHERGGFRAALYHQGDTLVLAFQGTNPSSVFNDWFNNFAAGTGAPPARQYAAASRLALDAASRYGDRLTVTGRSLGGGLASVASMALWRHGRLDRAVTLDAAGPHPETFDRHAFPQWHAMEQIYRSSASTMVTRYDATGDPVTALNELTRTRAIGRPVEIPLASQNIFDAHLADRAVERIDAWIRLQRALRGDE